MTICVGTPTILETLQAKTPHAPQVSSYGSTEVCGFATASHPRDPLSVRLNTCGRPLAGVELRAVDPGTGEDVPAGAAGELLVRSPARFVRYHGDPETTSRVIDADGWFHTGDLGCVREDGRVVFLNRLKDMLKVGGENVAAAEIEAFLSGHPAVEIVQVVAAPDARYGEVPAAFVQLRSGETVAEDDLIDFCRGRIATFKIPRYVRFVSDWPMSDTKIQKFRLRERIARELGARGITEAPKLTSTR
jgi:fatty-acyl-CoA synthase